ncbi:MAG: DNA repair protein RecN [Bacilli bacterium]|nr:DNA repair protein RecN [Bacilli bacterium]
MLTRLRITNFAIIENIDVSFGDGFTVLTGETGAGKSLVIDSLSLLLGARASSELIRQGEEKATVIGDFIVRSKKLEAELSAIEVPFIENRIRVERTISKTKNYIKINDVPATLADLNKIAPYLADIHVQFDSQKLLNPENYLSIVDGFNPEIARYLASYIESLQAYRLKKQEYEALKKKQEDIERGRDFYAYQLNELKAFGLKENEEEEIEGELSLLKNYDKIYALYQTADGIIREDFVDRLYELNRTLEKLSEFRDSLKEPYEKLDNAYYEMTDIFSDLKKDFQNLDYDPSRLDELMSRQSDLESLKRKYKKDIPALISYRDELESMVGDHSGFEAQIANKAKELEEAKKQTISLGKDLFTVRKQAAKQIEAELGENLIDLGLQAKFAISFRDVSKADETYFTDSGIDSIAFLIETNVGEGMRNLDKVISGGEASRIMLAFKAIFVKANRTPTVIFDEIDTGISGEIAYKVAKKIYEISLARQVIAITHMPQVASFSDHHIKISKSIKGGRTYTDIRELGLEEKIREIAFIISDGEPTPKQLDYAREMVLNSRG